MPYIHVSPASSSGSPEGSPRNPVARGRERDRAGASPVRQQRQRSRERQGDAGAGSSAPANPQAAGPRPFDANALAQLNDLGDRMRAVPHNPLPSNSPTAQAPRRGNRAFQNAGAPVREELLQAMRNHPLTPQAAPAPQQAAPAPQASAPQSPQSSSGSYR